MLISRPQIDSTPRLPCGDVSFSVAPGAFIHMWVSSCTAQLVCIACDSHRGLVEMFVRADVLF